MHYVEPYSLKVDPCGSIILIFFYLYLNAGVVSKDSKLEQNVLAVFVLMVCFVALFQCFAGSDVLRWRSFYATEDSAWKAHYREVFDVGIREALCCLGRAKYL